MSGRGSKSAVRLAAEVIALDRKGSRADWHRFEDLAKLVVEEITPCLLAEQESARKAADFVANQRGDA